MSKHQSRVGLALAAALLLVACRPSLVDVAGGEERLLEHFRDLHQRVYQVYDIGPDRVALHDHLSTVFGADELTTEYVEHFTTLFRMRQEGTGIRVLAVDYESTEILASEPDEVRVAADWSVGGIVTHQRHRHHRVNRYRALYTLGADAPGDPASLRIVDSRMRDAERLRTPLTGVSSFPLDDLPRSERGLMGPAELLRSGLFDQDERVEPEGSPSDVEAPPPVGDSSPSPTP